MTNFVKHKDINEFVEKNEELQKTNIVLSRYQLELAKRDSCYQIELAKNDLKLCAVLKEQTNLSKETKKELNKTGKKLQKLEQQLKQKNKLFWKTK